jgi:hypothetical protein
MVHVLAPGLLPQGRRPVVKGLNALIEFRHRLVLRGFFAVYTLNAG